jgi:hypothetical protein
VDNGPVFLVLCRVANGDVKLDPEPILKNGHGGVFVHSLNVFVIDGNGVFFPSYQLPCLVCPLELCGVFDDSLLPEFVWWFRTRPLGYRVSKSISPLVRIFGVLFIGCRRCSR